MYSLYAFVTTVFVLWLASSYLGNFVGLVKQMLLTHLVQVARNSVSSFLQSVAEMAMDDDERDGCFEVVIFFPSEAGQSRVSFADFKRHSDASEITPIYCITPDKVIRNAFYHKINDKLCDTDILALSPSREEFASAMHALLSDIPQILMESAAESLSAVRTEVPPLAVTVDGSPQTSARTCRLKSLNRGTDNAGLHLGSPDLPALGK